MSVAAPGASLPQRRLFYAGRVFISGPFDYLLVGGGLSLLVFGGLLATGQLSRATAASFSLPFLVLAFNSAHFAASTVRLYRKPGAFREWPFLTMGLPLLTLAVLSAAVVFPEFLGKNLYALMLTWSPFHYAAQAFGLACMYTYRSGETLDAMDRRLLWWTCMLPFLRTFVVSNGVGLSWLLPPSVQALPWVLILRGVGWAVLTLGTFAVPLALALRFYVRSRSALPTIVWLIILTNGIWWVVFEYMDAFAWATVFHGIQYLAVVMIFYVKDQTALATNRHGPIFHALYFYGISLALGYLLFYVWPYAYVAVGFTVSQSMLMVWAVINIHHFIVDRYIWRLRKDPNYEIVVADS